jgi:hypothetical protein
MRLVVCSTLGRAKPSGGMHQGASHILKKEVRYDKRKIDGDG